MQPFLETCPCGEGLDYDPAFIMLQSRLQPKLGAEYGSFVEVTDPINWTETERDCQSLLQTSKDIRLIIILMRCRLRKVGLLALAEGLEVLQALLTQWPDDLHPQLLDEGDFTPMLRANAFAELENIDGLLTDLRNQPLPKAAGLQIAIKEFEKAHQASREAGMLSETTVAALVHDWHLNSREAIRPLLQAHTFLSQIQQTLTSMLGEEAPELAMFRNILALFAREFGSEAPIAAPSAEPLPEVMESPSLNTPAAAAVSQPERAPLLSDAIAPAVQEVRKGIHNRADALHQLQEVRSWFGVTEPSSPLIPLLKYAEESIGKNFAELLKMYPAEIVVLLSQEKE